MRLVPAEALRRLGAHDHGVLCTVHAERGVDAVPVAFALDPAGWVGVPVDLVKAKTSLRLQRQRNVEADARAALLVERWDARDWTQLWWARAELRWEAAPGDALVGALAARLADRYPQYRDQPFAAVLVFRLLAVTGWSATDPARPDPAPPDPARPDPARPDPRATEPPSP